MMTLTPRIRFVASAVALALALGGCSLIVDDRTPRVVNQCAGDVDCSGGAHCDPVSAMCVQVPELPYDLWLQVTPPSDPSVTSIPTDLGPYTSFAGAISLAVPRPTPVRGTVRRGDVPVSAQITFTPTQPSALGGRAVIATTSGASGDVDFSTQLPSRGTYDVLVEPIGAFRATVPPFRAPMPLMLGVGGTALSIVLPTDETHIIGDLVDDAGVPGFEVLAIDRATGARISSVSTTGTDAAAPGHFDVVLPATGSAFDLVIRPTADRQASGLAPTYRIAPELLMPDATGAVRILVPGHLVPVHWRGTVEYPETRGMRPVAGAVIQLHSEDIVDASTGLVGSFDLTVTTDAEGVYDAMLLPGTYTIAIVPSADEELGILRETRELRATAGSNNEILGHVFRLPLRTVLSGVVQSPDGDLIRDASVRAVPTGATLMGLTDPGVTRLARSSTATSGALGDFRVELDVGVYDLVVQPPEASRYPWSIVLDYGIGGSSAPLADVVQIDAPVVVESDLSWLDGGALASAEVRAYAVTPDHRVIQVGRTTSDAEGHARLLVPPMLGSHDPTAAAARTR